MIIIEKKVEKKTTENEILKNFNGTPVWLKHLKDDAKRPVYPFPKRGREENIIFFFLYIFCY